MPDIKEDCKETEQPLESFLLGISKELDELATEYGNYHVVTQWLESDAEEAIAEDVESRSPLLDLDLDDRYVRFVTRGLPWKQIRVADDRLPMRLNNFAIRFKRLASDNPTFSIAFVQGIVGGDGASLWHVFPVQAVALRVNHESKLICILGVGCIRSGGLWETIKTSLRRLLSGIRRSYFDDGDY